MIGTLYGLGVGPGDPELITVKAFRKLKESPVIAYPKKNKKEAKATPKKLLMSISVQMKKICWALCFQ
ncbi:precorrin-2 methylase [Priestia megaterium]